MAAPVVLHHRYVGNPNTLFDRLWAELPWIRHPDRPRRECWMNDYEMAYTYGSGKGRKTYESVAWHNDIRSLRVRLRKDYNIWMDGCFVNGYEGNRDHLGWHADDSPEMDDDREIVVISLGAEREIWIRPKGDNDPQKIERLLLTRGSALIMAKGMQDQYEHRIPKSPYEDCGPRLSLTFRGLVV